jgi:hypothetical protein
MWIDLWWYLIGSDLAVQSLNINMFSWFFVPLCVYMYLCMSRFDKMFQRKEVQPPEPPMDPPLRCNFNACFAPCRFALQNMSKHACLGLFAPCGTLIGNKNILILIVTEGRTGTFLLSPRHACFDIFCKANRHGANRSPVVSVHGY